MGKNQNEYFFPNANLTSIKYLKLVHVINYESFLQKTIRAYWSKRRVGTSGSFQNHPNSYGVTPNLSMLYIYYFHYAKFQILLIYCFINILKHVDKFVYTILSIVSTCNL